MYMLNGSVWCIFAINGGYDSFRQRGALPWTPFPPTPSAQATPSPPPPPALPNTPFQHIPENVGRTRLWGSAAGIFFDPCPTSDLLGGALSVVRVQCNYLDV